VPLETATYITSLVITNPDGSDQKNTADDHIRLIKACLKRSFPMLDGAVSLSHVQLMYLGDLSASVQVQLNNLRDGSATANNALYANSASFATSANSAANLAGVPAASYARRDQVNSISFNVVIVSGNSGQAPGTGAGFLQLNNTSSGWGGMTFRRTGDTIAEIAETAGSITNGALAFSMMLNNAWVTAMVLSPSTFTYNGFTIWHAGNDGENSGLNADLLDGYNASEVANGNTVVARTAQGYAYATYFNQSSSENENPNVTSVIVSSGDGFFRKATPAYLGTLMQTRNITGKSGTAKTVSGAAPAGGQDGDIWYQI
jgi:hypothetical protein